METAVSDEGITILLGFVWNLFDLFRKWVQKKQAKHEPSTPTRIWKVRYRIMKHVDLMLDIDLMNLFPVISSSAGVQDMSHESKSKPVPENPSFWEISKLKKTVPLPSLPYYLSAPLHHRNDEKTAGGARPTWALGARSWPSWKPPRSKRRSWIHFWSQFIPLVWRWCFLQVIVFESKHLWIAVEFQSSLCIFEVCKVVLCIQNIFELKPEHVCPMFFHTPWPVTASFWRGFNRHDRQI